MRIGDVVMGYWPASLFTSMAKSGGDIVAWGGEVADFTAQDNHTITQMGSGHFSSEGFQKSSYIRDIKYIGKFFTDIHPVQQDFDVRTTLPTCYNSNFDVHNSELRFFFGGPGCQTP